MKQKQSNLETILNRAYDIEFGTILENAFDNYKKIAGIGGVAFLLISILIAILGGGTFLTIYGFSNATEALTGFESSLNDDSSLVWVLLFSTLLAAIMSPINAGFIKMAYLADKNKDFSISTVFDYYKGSYFKELFLSAILISVTTGLVQYIAKYLDFSFIGTLTTYVISFLTLLVIPLIIFSNLNAVQAITASAKIVIKHPFIIIGLLIVSFIFVLLGIIGLCIGIFFTIPFMFSMYYSIYNAILPIDEKDEIEQIGISQE